MSVGRARERRELSGNDCKDKRWTGGKRLVSLMGRGLVN